MKIIWICDVLLSLGLTFADKLDRTYLPPPGSVFSGGSPGAINIPLELPRTKYEPNVERKTEVPKIIIGIDRVTPNQVDEFNDSVSTSKPSIKYNNNYFTAPTKTSASSSPFNILENYTTAIPAAYFDPENLSKNIDNIQYSIDRNTSDFFPYFQPMKTTNISQKYQTVPIYPQITKFDKVNHIYLPSRVEDIGNRGEVASSTKPSVLNNDKDINNEYKYTQPTISNDEYTSTSKSIDESYNPTASILPQNYPNDLKSNIFPKYNHSQLSSTIPTATRNRQLLMFNNDSANKRPERIQAESDRHATILNYDQVITPEGYSYNYDTSNGIHADESGTATDGVKANGSYSYIGDNGNVYHVVYTADENGFVPKGAHLPTSPPIPDAILKVIEQAAKEKEAGIYDDGSYNEAKYGYKKYQGHYGQNNNKINEENLDTEKNKPNLKTVDQFKDYEDLQAENGLSKKIKNYDYANNIKPYENHNINPQKKHSDDTLSIKTVNNFYPNDIFAPSKKVNNAFGDDINKSIDKYPLTSDSMPVFNKNDITSDTVSGYQYFAPQTKLFDMKELKSFPPRFSEMTHNFNKGTSRPFLTPYVSRKDDYSDDFNEKSFENDYNENYMDDQDPPVFVQDNITQSGDSLNADENIDSQKYISEIPEQRNEDDTENSSHITTNHPFNEPNVSNLYTSENAISTFQKSHIPSITLHDTSLTKAPIYPSETTRPISSVNDLISDYPKVNSKTDVISTAKSTQSPRPELVTSSLEFATSHSPSTEGSSIYDSQSTDSIIGEDFSGPKQHQRFDPVTGYHY